MCKGLEFYNIWLTICVRGRVKHENLVLSNACSHERLTLEKSAFQIFYGGNLIFTNTFDENKF